MLKEELINAYKTAKYVVVDQNIDHRIRVGEHDFVIEKMLSDHDARFAYFITPENPFSQNLTNEENDLRHKRFTLSLSQKDLTYLEGYGTDEDESWQREKSYLIFCNNGNDMHQLAAHFGQLGILKIERNSPVMLLILANFEYLPVIK
ncbi:DUF3293 domain-containing protein [Brumicola nitratireducens]|uniref:DUF3293 domain-containing protein n=1 Tax=Glaciecola nitratireducens (strain JCM 12485 / KCTC 12276 / FR1064) TaxID=1085623 RepID=G4QH88_GLANF|nr:DUF3293 domain-containing protein [Glaciecola nitratireducens]AEP29719.1 hypothetical protein GNIT_1602 [Glaciecola nitratireducens FR1064]